MYLLKYIDEFTAFYAYVLCFIKANFTKLLLRRKFMKMKYYARSILIALSVVFIFTLTVLATSESGNLGSRGTYAFSCNNGNIFSKYVEASSNATYNGSTDVSSDFYLRYAFTNGRARVDVTLDDGTNNTNAVDFEGGTFSGDAYVRVYGLNSGSAYCYARVSGVLLKSDNTYSNNNQIKTNTLVP